MPQAAQIRLSRPSHLRAAARSAALLSWTLLMLPAGLLGLLMFWNRARAARYGAGAAHLWSKGVCRILGVELRASRLRPPRCSFVASNHVSWVDIPVLLALYPTNFIAKHEIAGWPVLGWLARLAGTLWVDRERMRDTVRLREELHFLLQNGLTITMFAEGWSGDGASVRPFRPPLFAAPAALQVPCVPAAVSYRTPGSGPGAAGPDAGSPHLTVCWWDGTPLLAHYWRMARLSRVEALICFGEAVSGIDDRKALAGELQRRAAAMFEPVPR